MSSGPFIPPASTPQDILTAQIGNLLARVRILEAVRNVGSGVDLAYPYTWGIDDANLGYICDGPDGLPAANKCMGDSAGDISGSVALLQGQGVPTTYPYDVDPAKSPQGSLIIGYAAYIVTDAAVFAGATEVSLFPTWGGGPGTGPYIDWNVPTRAKCGSGTVWQYSSSGQGIPFDCFTSGHSRLDLRMQADGSVIDGTNPFVFQNGDVITASWTAFVYSWD